MEGTFLTDRGKVRQHNEDNGGIFQNQAGEYLVLIADGMGGHRAGDVASKIAVKVLKESWEETTSEMNPILAEQWLSTTILEANEALIQHAKANAECEGMGTTIVATILNEEFITIGHIGDSRCYVLSGSDFQLKTNDHSLVNELLKSGQITEQEAANHPKKNVLIRALGTNENVEVTIQTIGWDEEDTILLCSDGLSDKLSIDEIEPILRNGQTISKVAEQLVSKANDLGGEDNISVAIVKHDRNSPESRC
jgi:PPM family protein phosphatase